MPKTKPKPTKKTVPPPPRPTRRTKKRMREAVHAKPTKKASKAMTTATAKDDTPRGAGSGEHATATRSRQYNEKATEYAKGDIAKGRIDPEKLTEGQTAEQIATRDRRAYLLDQAEKNEAANDELNAIQVEQNKRVQLGQNILQDPDEMRESSMETAINALKQHDPDERRKYAENQQKQHDQRVQQEQKGQHDKNSTKTT